jgi:VPDSG-CTERM motif
MNLSIFKKTLVLAAATILITAASARADTITLDNSNISSNVTTYATVEYTLDVATQTATFTFTAGSGYVLMDGSAAGLNIDSTAFTANFSSATASSVPGSSPSLASFDYYIVPPPPGNVDGFGSFNLQLNLAGGYGDSASVIVFTVTNTSGTAWVTESDVLFSNTKDGSAVAHVAPTSLGGACTGYASDGTTTSTGGSGSCASVPDGGSTVALLGSVLIALGLFARKLRAN